MDFYSHVPDGPLSEYIENFWHCSDAPVHTRERILPSGTIEFVFNLHEDEVRIYDPTCPDRYQRFPGAVASGTYARPFIIDPSQHKTMLGVHFKPGGAFRFLGIEANELANNHVPLNDLWGRVAEQVRENLCYAKTPCDRFRIIERSFIERLHCGKKCHPAVIRALDLIGATGDGESTRNLSQRLGLSQRQLIQVFKTQVGLTPKQFGRILRFQHARTLANTIEKFDWSQLAMSCGFYDQPHLIHDFQEFSGLSPTKYIADQSSNVLRNHVPVFA